MKEKFFLFLSLFFLICACISGFFLFRYYHQSYEQEQQYDEVAAIYYEVAGNELYADDEKQIPKIQIWQTKMICRKIPIIF